MKQRIFLVICLLTLNICQAQQINLKKGQQLIISDSSVSEMDMGMGMMMTTSNKKEIRYEVLGEAQNMYELSGSVKRIRMVVDMMGMTQSYDSENEKDRNSEIGQTIEPELKETSILYLNRSSGKITSKDSTAKMNVEQLPGISQPVGAQVKSLISKAFIVLNDEKMKNRIWSEQDSSSDFKLVTVYTLESIQGDSATIKYESVATGNSTVEQGGMRMTMKITATTNGNIISDIKTNLLRRTTANAVITGTMEVMGQEMPLSGTAKSVVIYNWIK